MTKRLPCKDIGEVHFNERKRGSNEGISQRDRGMGVRRSVHDGSRNSVVSGPMYSRNQLSLHIGLVVLQRDAEFRGQPIEIGCQVAQGLSSIRLRFARAEQVEVRSLEDEHSHRQFWDDRITC